MAGRISFALRLAAIPCLVAVIAILETRQPFGMFRLITFGAVFFLLADIASLLGGNWRDFLLVLASLAFGIFVIEATDPKTGGIIYSADYTIDSNLLRLTQSCEKGPAVVFFGCSFAFGLGLNDADTLPQAFADSVDRKVRIVNLGYPAYGPHQFLSELQGGFSIL
jgi:hypothetical protein